MDDKNWAQRKRDYEKGYHAGSNDQKEKDIKKLQLIKLEYEEFSEGNIWEAMNKCINSLMEDKYE